MGRLITHEDGRHVAGVIRATETIVNALRANGHSRALLTGISGIDGSGKTALAGAIGAELRERDLNVAVIGVDGWLDLPARRFGSGFPGRHFYQHAIRFGPMFDRLVSPLVKRGSHRVTVDYAEETATEFRPHTYDFTDVDIVLVEGIFILRRDIRVQFDLSFWIDCTFETALERAVARAQEGLPTADTVRAYETIYFPAQRVHLAQDDPRSAADRILVNDWRLER